MNQVKTALTVLAAAAATVSAAQSVVTDGQIQSAYNLIRGETEIMVDLAGTDQYGPRINHIYSKAFFQWNPLSTSMSTAKAEIDDYLNTNPTHRITADGTTLWSYDFARNTYTSFRYGAYSGAEPPDY